MFLQSITIADSETREEVWEFEADDGSWHPMEAVPSQCSRGIYSYNLQTMSQVNTDTNKSRRIRKTIRTVNLLQLARQNDQMVAAILRHTWPTVVSSRPRVRQRSFDTSEQQQQRRIQPCHDSNPSWAAPDHLVHIRFQTQIAASIRQVDDQQRQLRSLRESIELSRENSERQGQRLEEQRQSIEEQRQRIEDLERQLLEQESRHQQQMMSCIGELQDRAGHIDDLNCESKELEENLKQVAEFGLKRHLQYAFYCMLHPAPDVPSPSRFVGDARIVAVVTRLLQETAVDHRNALRADRMSSRPMLILDSVDMLFNRSRSAQFALYTSQTTASELPVDFNPLLLLRNGEALTAYNIDSLLQRVVLLWHGSESNNIERIVDEGFRLGHAGSRAGSMFGRGFYFAENSSKADLYCGSRPHRRPDTSMKMLLCAVCLGNAYTALTAQINLLVPRFPGPEGSTMLYDTVVGESRARGGQVDHREFVVFSEQQVLPMAVVTYHHDPEVCRCSRCSS